MPRNPKDIFFVSIQLILFVSYLFRIAKIDFAIHEWLQYTGLVFAVTGFLITVSALIALNKNLSPFPTPKQTGQLIQRGIYKYIRHPIYTGILFFSIGYAVYSENTLRFIVFVFLLIFFTLKAAYEEELLQQKFPNYAAYKKTTGIFFPCI